jgi:hypothetical protein
MSPKKKTVIVAGRYRLVKITEDPRETIHLHFIPPDIVKNPLAEMKFAQALPFGMIIPVAAKFSSKLEIGKIYGLSLQEEE